MRWLPLLTLAVAVACLVGCDSIDATEQSFPVTFVNDTGRDVQLKLCDDSSCHSFDYSDSWSVGQSAQENISDRNVFTRWLVQDETNGRTLGCIPLEFGQKYRHVRVRISEMVPCPGSAALAVAAKGTGLGQS